MMPKFKVGDEIGFYNYNHQWVEAIITDIKQTARRYTYVVNKHPNIKSINAIIDAYIPSVDRDSVLLASFRINRLWQALNV